MAQAQDHWTEHIRLWFSLPAGYEKGGDLLLNKIEYSTTHSTERNSAQHDRELFQAWETYRREVGRMLAEGKEGKRVLVKGNEIIGFWDTHVAALAVGLNRFRGEAFLVHHV